MKLKIMAMATALSAIASTSAWADGNPSAGVITYKASSGEGYQQITNAVNGAVRIDKAWLDAVLPAGGEITAIKFGNGDPGWTSNEIKIDEVALDVDNEDLTVSAVPGTGIRLQSVGTNSMFNLTLAAARHATFDGITFAGANQRNTDFAPYDGGAIHTDGGALTLKGCSFENFVTRFSGGAVSAWRLDDDMLVTNCTFASNRAHPFNGYGGAIYASTSAGNGANSVALVIRDSQFAGNSAENGGAICTLKAVSNDEEPVELRIGDACAFTDNEAAYEGGAVIAEGNLDIAGSNTVFRTNRAGLSGGAVCVTGVEIDFNLPCVCTVSNATFESNTVGTNTTWSAGGALAIMPAGCELHVGGHAFFTNNVASTAYAGCNQPSLGGAIYTGTGVTNVIARALFVGNDAKASGIAWCYGGALAADGGATTIDTCVFDCGTDPYAKCYGNAVDFNEVGALLKNSTFRRGTVEAVSAYNGTLAITNCVILGNGLTGNYDVYVEGDTAITMAYTAYGKFGRTSGTTYAVTNNLADRAAAEVYDGDALRLRATGFNPVAGLGLEQSMKDFAGVTYGSKNYGYSMGAYEAPTERFIVVLDGTRDYDSTTESNGCVWTWSTYTNRADAATSCAWADLVTGAASTYGAAYDITSWAYGNPAVGYYASTNGTLTAAVKPTNKRVAWLSTIVSNEYAGTIHPAKTIRGWLIPTEFEWTGGGVCPGDLDKGASVAAKIIVSNTVENILVPETEYRLDWAYNVDPTNYTEGAEGAQLHIICTNNYAGTVFTNYFAITAYLTRYYTNGVEYLVTTNGALSGSNAVAKVDAEALSHTGFYADYCLDWQNATTNKEVCVYNPGHSEPITTLKMLYCTDVVTENDDGTFDFIPDKYQKKVVFATVNGYWNGESNGYDKCKWVTLTNATDGAWDANAGVCSIPSARVPGIGEKPFYRFAAEEDVPGTWNDNPAGFVVNRNSLGIFFYSPASVSARSDDDKKDVTPLRAMALMAAAEAAERTDSPVVPESAIAITDFGIGEDGSVAGAVEGQIRDANTGRVMRSIDLPNADLEVWGAPTLEGPWTKVEVTTDADSVWTVSRMRTSSVRVTRVAAGDRTYDFSASDATEPKFFKVSLVTEQ